MKKRISKNIFHFLNLIKALKKKKRKIKKEKTLFWFKTSFKKQKSKFSNSLFDFKSKNEFQKVLLFFNFGYEIKKWKIFKIRLVFKSKNELYFRYTDFWCFLSQLQYKNENQNFISNFIFQFIKKQNGTLGTRILAYDKQFFCLQT